MKSLFRTSQSVLCCKRPESASTKMSAGQISSVFWPSSPRLLFLRATELLLGSLPGVASVIANILFVPQLSALQDRGIVSLTDVERHNFPAKRLNNPKHPMMPRRSLHRDVRIFIISD